MIISFETDDSPVLSRFLHVFEHPEDSGTELKSLWNSFILSYFSRKVWHIDRLTIIEMEGFFEVGAKICAYLTFIAMIVSIIFKWTVLFNIGFFCIILFFALLSPNVRTWLYVSRIKLGGHKPKVKLPSNSYVIQRLLFERDKLVPK
jgi:hypothetical protein